MTDCVEDDNRDCMIQETCPCKANWLKINNAVRAALQEISLDRMSAGCRFDGTETLGAGSLETGILDTEESTITNELA